MNYAVPFLKMLTLYALESSIFIRFLCRLLRSSDLYHTYIHTHTRPYITIPVSVSYSVRIIHTY